MSARRKVPCVLIAEHVEHGGYTLCGARPVDRFHVSPLHQWRQKSARVQCDDCREWVHA